MHFKKGDLAIIVDGPWKEAVGKVVKVIWKCQASFRRGVSVDGLGFWMTADGPIYLVRPVASEYLPAGFAGRGKPHLGLRRRPVCGCHMRPVLRTGISIQSEFSIAVGGDLVRLRGTEAMPRLVECASGDPRHSIERRRPESRQGDRRKEDS